MSPGGSAAGEQQVRAREGWGDGQAGRLSDGQDGQVGGAAAGQQPVGIGVTGAGQIASTGEAATSGRSPATRASARSARSRGLCLAGMSCGL